MLPHPPFYAARLQKIEISEGKYVFFTVKNDFARCAGSGKDFIQDP